MPTQSTFTFVCFSHLRWNFVYQRPQHLLSRAAKKHRVLFIEEANFCHESQHPRLDKYCDPSGVHIYTPLLPRGEENANRDHLCTALLTSLYASLDPRSVIAWYYTPLALGYSEELRPALTVYDCMDELSAFKFASPALKDAEAALMDRADVVFAGGQSLYEAKCRMHSNVHVFPSSVEAAHFGQARRGDHADPADQASIPRPRLGFFGVIDERFDFELLTRMADLRPHWSFVMVGPTAKIDARSLPQRNNIHWLGAREYRDLPRYLAHWDLGIMPFALNDATRFISPTKTPEFLAAGLPLVSTPITDVVRPYRDLGLVRIASDAGAFVAHCEDLLANRNRADRIQWLTKVDFFLSGLSWDRTWEGMQTAMRGAFLRRDGWRGLSGKSPAAAHA